MTTTYSFRCRTCGMALWHPIASLGVSTLGLYDDNRYRGRCLLVLNEHHNDMATMPYELAASLLNDARVAAKAIQTAVNADKINYAVLGNVNSHVHYHLIPRNWGTDPAPGQSPWQTDRAARPLSAADLDMTTVQIRHQIERQTTATPTTNRPEIEKEPVMTAPLAEPSSAEVAITRLLQERSKEIMSSRDRQEIANKLGLALSGVESLLWQDEWTIERALRVADALGILDHHALNSLTGSVMAS